MSPEIETSVSWKERLLKALPKLAVGSASVLAALYVGLSPRMSPALYNKRLFRPAKYPEGEWSLDHLEGIPREDVYFCAPDGSRLHGWLFHRPNSKFIHLFSHGHSGNLTGRLSLVALLLRANASVLIYDYRGYGHSEGRPTISGVCEDGIAAYDFLVREKGYTPAEIVLYGESLGCAITSEIAAARPCAGIVLQSGFTSLKDIGGEYMPITRLYPHFMYPRPLLDNVKRMSMDRRPLLIIHGQKDQVVPFRHAQRIFEEAAQPKMFVELPEAAHSDIWSVSPAAYVDAVKSFLESLFASQ
ncbi:MAG TPA: alpha/beta hydrolase [Candidatus Obscuribacterales bacterium]